MSKHLPRLLCLVGLGVALLQPEVDWLAAFGFGIGGGMFFVVLEDMIEEAIRRARQ